MTDAQIKEAFADFPTATALFDALGRVVREAWVKWAKMQPNPKPSWLVPFDELLPDDQEADRQIGIAVSRWTIERMQKYPRPGASHEAAFKARVEALEEAAKVADNAVPHHTGCGLKIARAIRALAAAAEASRAAEGEQSKQE